MANRPVRTGLAPVDPRAVMAVPADWPSSVSERSLIPDDGAR
jgi:hypothetical protein